MNGCSILAPFLYPTISTRQIIRLERRFQRLLECSAIRGKKFHTTTRLCQRSSVPSNRSQSQRSSEQITTSQDAKEARRQRLNPTPDDYQRNIFVDKCIITVSAGGGGNGCVSFHRDAIISDGPPNGGDGGGGGNVWIQALPGQTSLHKLARRGNLKAGRGISGKGKSQGGRKGEDICIQVPVGTVIREIWRSDPVADEEARLAELKAMPPEEAETAAREYQGPRSSPWIMYPGAQGQELTEAVGSLPKVPRPRRSNLHAMQPRGPIHLDLDQPMEKPMLLAAGAVGGLGNPHFATKDLMKPKYATKGEFGIKLRFEVELKLLADVGLVGLPNAGKSTLLRAISNSRTRVGDWAFTTLEPSIGTVILDTNEGRPLIKSGIEGQSPRTHFTVADIPGLIEDAHLDRGLGLGFLRHIERARILAFVVDLSDGDPVGTLQNLWREVSEYENLRNEEINTQTQKIKVDWSGFGTSPSSVDADLQDEEGQPMLMFPEPTRSLEPIKLPPISAKPWYVVAAKADKPDTQERFRQLNAYVQGIESGDVPHPCGQQNAWKTKVAAIPISALNDEGTDRIAQWTANLLDSMQGAGVGTGVVNTGQGNYRPSIA